METPYDRSRIERLKRGLYDPDGRGAENDPDAALSQSPVEVASDWGDTTIKSERKQMNQGSRRIGMLKIFVILAALTALFSVGYLLYEYFDPFANPSQKNIAIMVDVPVGTTPGVPAPLVFRITNKNRVPLEYATFVVTYPSDTRSGDDPDANLHEEKKIFGTIGAGQSVEYNTEAIFLGEEHTEKEVRASLEYRFSGINSIFTKEEIRPIQILAAPINLSVDTLKEINPGQPFEISVTALSNTVIPLRDVFLKIVYPTGFTYSTANPKPDFGTNIWRVGTLMPSGKFSLKVRGTLSGAETEEKVFRVSTGVGGDKTARDIHTLYSTVISPISVMRPFIGTELLLNGKPAGDVPVPFGMSVQGVVKWQNNLDAKIEQGQIEVRLSGAALNRSSIKAENGGFYRSTDNTIIWDSRGAPELAVLEAGATGSVVFSFQPLPPISGSQALLNPIITAEVTVRGKRISESGVPEEIKSVMTKNVRVSSDVQLVSRSVYYSGPFVNLGPIPPQVERETTYTVIWSIVNTSNNISNAQVRAVLPIYMKWYGTVSPSKEDLIYSPNTHEIIWSPGDIPAGVGVGKPPREVAFQVVLTPSLSQVSKIPELVTQTTFSALDTFTGTQLRQEKPNLTTDLSTDPKAQSGSEIVVP